MSSLVEDFKSGFLSAGINSVDTSLSSSEFSVLQVVASPDTMKIVLDPQGIAGDPEIVTVTTHTASATTVTVTRGGNARSHSSSTRWVHAATASDFQRIGFEGVASFDSLDVLGSADIDSLSINSAFTFPTTDGLADQVLTTNGLGTVSWGSISASPAGSDGQVQYNNGGSFGGASSLYYDDVNNRVGIGTASPGTPLEVSGNVTATTFLGVLQGAVSIASTTDSSCQIALVESTISPQEIKYDTALDWNASSNILTVGGTVSASTFSGSVSGGSISGTTGSFSSTLTVSSTLTASSTIRSSDGSASAAAYSFSSDTNTGMFRNSGSSFLGLAWNGSTGLAIRSTDVIPGSDNTKNLGDTSFRWVDVWALDTSINTSDSRDKREITDLDLGLDFVLQLRPVHYKWNDRGGYVGTRKHHGFVAQEVAAALGPEAANRGLWISAPGKPAEPGMPGGKPTPPREALRPAELIPVLTKAIQELAARVEALEAS